MELFEMTIKVEKPVFHSSCNMPHSFALSMAIFKGFTGRQLFHLLTNVQIHKKISILVLLKRWGNLLNIKLHQMNKIAHALSTRTHSKKKRKTEHFIGHIQSARYSLQCVTMFSILYRISKRFRRRKKK